MSEIKEEQKSLDTVALVEPGMLYRASEKNDKLGRPILLQKNRFIKSLEESEIRIKAWSSRYDYEDIGARFCLPIHYFFQEKNCEFWTKYDPYYSVESIAQSTEEDPPKKKISSWRDYYQDHYTRNSSHPFQIAAARDLYFQVFVNIRLTQLGILTQSQMGEKISSDNFRCSDDELSKISTEEAKSWRIKLNQLKPLIFEEVAGQSFSLKDFSIPASMKALEEFYRDELEIVQSTPFDYKLTEKYKGNIKLFKGDLFAFALDRLHKEKVRNIIVFEKDMAQYEVIKGIYENFCRKNQDPPNLAVYRVEKQAKKKVAYRRLFVNIDFPLDKLAALEARWESNQSLSPALERFSRQLQEARELTGDDESDDDSLPNQSVHHDPTQAMKLQPPSYLPLCFPCCCYYPVKGLSFVAKKSFFPVVGVMTSLSFIGSFLSESQNHVLFKGFSDGLREDFIASLMTPCAHAPGNYASYVTGAVLVVLLMYYKRNLIKEKLDILKGVGSEQQAAAAVTLK